MFEPVILVTALINGLMFGAIYALVALGLTLIYGVLHIIISIGTCTSCCWQRYRCCFCF